MRTIWLLGLPILLVLSGPVDARSREATNVGKKIEKKKSTRKGRHVVKMASGAPKARIRQEATGTGLPPLAFAQWLATHRRLVLVNEPKLRLTASPTKLLNRSATYFSSADLNGDGRVSSAELADFVVSAGPQRAVAWRV
jgi:hypothetical protein